MNHLYKIYYNDFVRKLKKYKDKKMRRKFLSESLFRAFTLFGITGFYNYEFEFRNLPPRLRIYGRADMPVMKGSLRSTFGNRILRRDGYIKDSCYYDCDTLDTFRYAPKAVEVVVNCEAQLRDIIFGITKIVEETQQKRKKVLNTKGIKKAGNKTRKTYDFYLKVYRLRREQKLSNVAVAKKILGISDTNKYQFSKHYSADLRNAEDTVNKAYQKAKVIVNKEYRDITFNSCL